MEHQSMPEFARVYAGKLEAGLRPAGLLQPEECLDGTYTEHLADSAAESLFAHVPDSAGRVELTSLSEYLLLQDLLGAIGESPTPAAVDHFAASLEPATTGNIHRSWDVELRRDEPPEARVNTMYKTVDRKVRPVATELPPDAFERMERAKLEPRLRDLNKIGHTFTPETLAQIHIGDDGLLSPEERDLFRTTISSHGKAFAEIGCVDPKVVAPLIIFTVPHVPWKLKPIQVPRAHYDKLIALLRKRIASNVLEPGIGPYSNRWFTVPKKDGNLRFIQDLQPANKVTVQNTGVAPVVENYVEHFSGRAILSMCDLYSGYDQFQLERASRPVTGMQTPLGLVQMGVVAMGGTNSVAHVTGGVSEVLCDFTEYTLPFIDDIPIRGPAFEDKNESLVAPGVRKFVADHIMIVSRILERIIEVGLTFSGKKCGFGLREVLIVGYICSELRKKPDPKKVSALTRMLACENASQVRRFLGGVGFFRMFIPGYAAVAEPLYALLRKENPWYWDESCDKAMAKLKLLLLEAPILRPIRYSANGGQVYLTVDASPTAVAWVLSQSCDGERKPAKFGAKTLRGAQRNYGQTKRELYSVKTALLEEQQYVLGNHVVVETDCKALLGMLTNCTTPDLTCQRWIGVIKQFDASIVHITGEENVVADMLSRATYDDTVEGLEFLTDNTAGDSVTDEDSESESDFTVNALEVVDQETEPTTGDMIEFREDLYEGEFRELGLHLEAARLGEVHEIPRKLRRKAFDFFLAQGYLWRRAKAAECATPRRCVGKAEEKRIIMTGLHDHASAGHFGTARTYQKIRERYYWPGMYTDVERYVRTCATCQLNSNNRYFEELHPTYPSGLFQVWYLDLIMMPACKGYKMVVLAREGLSNMVEGRALKSKHTTGICRFILEEILCRYGCSVEFRADRGELNADEARRFFERYGIKLNLTTAYNPEANGKIERGHPTFMGALVKASEFTATSWVDLMPLALWADRTTAHRTTGRVPYELIFGERVSLPVEQDVASWSVMPWTSPMSREDLLAVRIRQLQRREEDIKAAAEKVRQVREKEKDWQDSRRPARPRNIEVGDWVIVRNEKIRNEFRAARKFEKKWFGPYEVTEVHRNTGTYLLQELDGTVLATRFPGKRVKVFYRRSDEEYVIDTELEEEVQLGLEVEEDDEGDPPVEVRKRVATIAREIGIEVNQDQPVVAAEANREGFVFPSDTAGDSDLDDGEDPRTARRRQRAARR